ncbi:hypothetical protein A2U01_0085693, partial [Trifolium medium]|nr:hypothetical protein [Trifolium medium]
KYEVLGRLELKIASRATCSAKVAGRRSYIARRDKLASCRQFSPDTGQHSVSVSPALARRQ